MEKINFNQVRGFGDSITLTFNFVKQEFVPLLKVFAIIALPLIFVDLFLKSSVARDALAMVADPSSASKNAFDNIGNTLLSYLSTAVVYCWMLLMSVSYIRVYQDKYREQREERITPGEVWKVMFRNMGKVILWSIVYLLMVVIGCVFLIIPGIYLSVIFSFAAYFIILQDKSLSGGMSSSMALVKGKWWEYFGYLLVLQLIVAGLSYVFSIPYMVLTFKAAFTQTLPGPYETTFGLMLATLGQNLLQIIVIVGIAVRFFSYREQKEHTELLGKINEIGSNGQPPQESEEVH